MVIFLVSLVVIDYSMVSNQRQAYLENAATHAKTELELVATFVTEPMLRYQFAYVEQFVLQWGEENKDVVLFRAFTPTGNLLTEYRRDRWTEHALEVRQKVVFSGQHILDLEMVKDLETLEQTLSSLKQQLIFRSLVMTMIIGLVLWVVFRVLALRPLEREIVRRRRAEEDLQLANEELEERVRERTSDLTEAYERLEAQNVELKKMDLIKDGLLRDVSHELKTPVAKYAMQLEILKPIIEKHKISEAEKNALIVMEESLRRQEGVIKNLLDLARLEDGVRKFRREPLRLDELIGKVVEDYQLLLNQYGGEITVAVPPITIHSDGEMLWHLFSNLLSNAIKFRRKEGRLRISLNAETVNGHVTVHVTDEGKGFSEEEREQAFERFFQSTASNEGSGVGLTICKMIVDGLGGRISILSEGKDRGAVVSVTLPTVQPH
jgi:signal transduction histidine kinase